MNAAKPHAMQRREVLKALTATTLLTCLRPSSARQALQGKKALVIGAGIAGLSAAYELRQAGFDVVIFEKRNWTGGRMREAWMGPLFGYTHAQGVLTAYAEMFDLAATLGIAEGLGPAPEDAYRAGEDDPSFGLDNGVGKYDFTAIWKPQAIRKIPGLSPQTRAKLPLLEEDLRKIRQDVDPCLLARGGASYDDESLNDYYERRIGKEAADEVLRYWIEPSLEWWGWPGAITSRIAMLSWLAQEDATFYAPKGGIGVVTSKLAKLLEPNIRLQHSVRYISPPDSSGRHTVTYLDPAFEQRALRPDVVVVATEGKFVYPLVQGLTPRQETFFKAIDTTKEAIVDYVLKPEAAPKHRIGGNYIPRHPDPWKSRVTSWSVTPPQPEQHNRPATARIDLSRPETPKWQMSNQPMERYCEPLIKHFWPDFDLRNVTDIVNYTCDDLIHIPTGYVREMALIVQEQERARRGLYFAGEFVAGAHTGAACASGRSVARLIAKHWSTA